MKKQQGMALLLTSIVLSLLAIAFLISQTHTTLNNKNKNIDNIVLQQAKEAILNYAMVYYELENNKSGKMGFLPCPDYRPGIHPPPGYSDGNCGSKDENIIGRFPWKSMKTLPFKDNSNSCLWYALTGSYRNSSVSVTTKMLNQDSNGNFEIFNADNIKIYGTKPHNRAVVVLLAPGAPFNNQARLGRDNNPCRTDYDPQQYLESINSINNYDYTLHPHSLDDFIKTDYSTADKSNDKMITVTSDEIFTAILKSPKTLQRFDELTKTLAMCMAEYATLAPHQNHLPYPVYKTSMADYRLSQNYTDKNHNGINLFGRYPFVIPASDNILNKSRINVINDCSLMITTPPRLKTMYQNYKDHFFYAITPSHSPTGTISSVCSDCLQVNNSGAYAAVVLFSNIKLKNKNQIRYAPPIDVDSKYDVANYLEGRNNKTNQKNFQSQTVADENFNDILYCIDTSMVVTKC
ncbi:MAG: hypothetical protein DRQ51_04605 [Gammaproteobacteria bacterium]|nr:MAG: hypothetical protein DRQ51_04605 [Gammaproteobacteria bacterium]